MAASFFSKLSRTASDNVAAAAAGEGGAGGPPAQDPGASTSSSSSPEDAVHCERMRSFSKAITEFAYDKAKDLMVTKDFCDW